MILDEFSPSKLSVKGYMSDKLPFIILISNRNLAPIIIYFFNNGKWSNATFCRLFAFLIYFILKILICFIFGCVGAIDPTYATPIIRHLPPNETVSLLCYVKKSTARVILPYFPQLFGVIGIRLHRNYMTTVTYSSIN